MLFYACLLKDLIFIRLRECQGDIPQSQQLHLSCARGSLKLLTPDEIWVAADKCPWKYVKDRSNQSCEILP